jgi:hypothetical protein
VAVGDLEQAKAHHQVLGFVAKPGRRHDNGLRNAHVKFADETEIELITAPAATDALASEYFAWLNEGDGPAFLGLYAPDDGNLVKRLAEVGLALDWKGGIGTFPSSSELHRLFFAHRQHSPSDRPEHFAHINTAIGLAGVWLASTVAERQLLVALGAVAKEDSALGPFGSSSETLSLPDGEIVLAAQSVRLAPGRTIVAATVTAGNLDAVRRTFEANRVPYHPMYGCGRRSLWVDPALAHGLWLEFREHAAPR